MRLKPKKTESFRTKSKEKIQPQNPKVTESLGGFLWDSDKEQRFQINKRKASAILSFMSGQQNFNVCAFDPFLNFFLKNDNEFMKRVNPILIS